MNKRLIFALLFILATMQFTCATDTVIKISTLSNHTVKLEFLNSDTSDIDKISLQQFVKLNTGDSGEISYPFSTSETTFRLRATLQKDGEEIISELISDITTGENLHIILIPGAVEITKNYVEPKIIVEESATTEIVNTSETLVENLTETSEAVSKENKSRFFGFLSFFRISGFANSENEKGSSGNTFYYAIAAIILAGIFFFIFAKVRKKKSALSGTNNIQKRVFTDEDELLDAEKRILEAEREIVDLKSKRIY